MRRRNPHASRQHCKRSISEAPRRGERRLSMLSRKMGKRHCAGGLRCRAATHALRVRFSRAASPRAHRLDNFLGKALARLNYQGVNRGFRCVGERSHDARRSPIPPASRRTRAGHLGLLCFVYCPRCECNAGCMASPSPARAVFESWYMRSQGARGGTEGLPRWVCASDAMPSSPPARIRVRRPLGVAPGRGLYVPPPSRRCQRRRRAARKSGLRFSRNAFSPSCDSGVW
ncbi:MAG: hypothetical protein KatS3mg077_2913 [Candidatus Binatia bacterium]|nr:MAG: hypothetical protein KatS3mg077_2913 [Candidatus Binatia bacterium]